ncbi:MAG: hypothetical protein IPM74_03795 [Crocinitomicaceae bacterium]|nr:hypothetical protein [Crocinitomicaceae bacterium]MBK8925036.1 hypothetical protein [Crocinitomicaceae bacterium]
MVSFSCTTNHEVENGSVWTPLSEKEKYQIISEGYSSYLSSNSQKKEIYYRFAILEDSASMDYYIESFEKEISPIITVPQHDPFSSHWFEDEIDTAYLPEFEFTSKETIDSISSEGIKWFEGDANFYAITRPYQPDSSSYALIQQFELPHPKTDYCPSRYIIILFKKNNGKWCFVDWI